MSFSLAECEKITAVDFLGRLFIAADGHKPTPCFVVRIVQSPLLIFPPQFEVQWESKHTGPCADVVLPYHVVGGPFLLPAGSKTVKVSCLRGGKPVTEDVPIQIVKAVAAPAAAVAATAPVVDTARGFSNSFCFEEAFKDAIANLPNRPPRHPDELSTVIVKDIGAEFGGIVGFNHMFVDVERTSV